MSGPREDIGYGKGPLAEPVKPKSDLPYLTSEQLRTLRRVQKGSLLDRKMWTLLAMSELAHMRLIQPSSPMNERWVLSPRGVEVLELAKGRQT